VALALDSSLAPFSWVGDDLAAPLADYHASFELQLNTADLPAGVDLELLNGYTPAGEPLFQLVLTRNGGEDRLYLVGYEEDGGTQTSSESDDIGSGWHTVEIAYAAGDGDGLLSLSTDAVAQTSLTALDNAGLTVGSVRLGFPGGDRQSTSGAFWLDDFQSWTGVP
jgi:hypothetical protein